MKVWEQIFTALKNLFKECISEIKYQSRLEQERQKAIVAEQKKQYLQELSFSIQRELFQAMHNSDYVYLNKIYYPKNIRVYSIERINQGYLFCYCVMVTRMPARIVLNNLQTYINTDIAQLRKELSYVLGNYDATQQYPHIMSGLSVVAVEPLACEVLIKVKTNYYPPIGF